MRGPTLLKRVDELCRRGSFRQLTWTNAAHLNSPMAAEIPNCCEPRATSVSTKPMVASQIAITHSLLRHWTWRMLQVLVLASWCFSETGLAAQDPLGKTKEFEEQLRKLDETPIGKRISEMERKFSDATTQAAKANEDLRNEFSRIQQTDVYREYQKRRRDLEEKQDAAWVRERKAMADAARKLYSARHEELKRLALGDTPEARKLGFDVLTFPRLDGSTSTHPLNVIIASRVLGTPYEWMYPEPIGSKYRVRPVLPIELFLFDPYDPYPSAENMEFNLAASKVVAKPPRPGLERLAIMINSLLAISTSTHDAYTNLIAGKCDLNLTARAPSADELALARSKGVTIELRPIAKDALVFIVNQQNPIKSIPQNKILEIYRGEISQWSHLGGTGSKIVPLWRERNSGSRELFDALIVKAQRLAEPDLRGALFSNSMAGPFNRVTQDVNSLGYSVYYYEHFMALSPYTRNVAIDDVEPNPQSIASDHYPLTTKVYAAYRAKEPADSPGMKLLAWLLSPEGQAVVRESGYVPAK